MMKLKQYNIRKDMKLQFPNAKYALKNVQPTSTFIDTCWNSMILSREKLLLRVQPMKNICAHSAPKLSNLEEILSDISKQYTQEKMGFVVRYVSGQNFGATSTNS